jgi:dipeptidyl aminopeptidase/acylaminoacyl peptidase
VGAPAVSPDGRAVAYTRDLRDVAVVSLAPDAGWPVRLSTGADFAADPAWTADGRRVLWQEWDVPAMPWDDSRIVGRSADGTGAVDVVHDHPDAQSLQVQPSPHDPGMVAFLTDTSGWLNVTIRQAGGDTRPVVAEPHEHGSPTWVQGQRSFAWSPEGHRIAFARNEAGFGRLCVADLATGQVTEVAKGWHEGLSWQGGALAAIRSGAKTPTQLVVYSTATWDRTVLSTGPVSGWAPHLSEPEPLHWTAPDGAEVHGRLYRPAGVGSGAPAPPLLVWTHGGPTAQSPVSFQARTAFFVAHGWAILATDHRGSTGHGRAYTMAMRERWGDLDVTDTLAGVHYVLDQGWCDPRRVVAIGGSSGGFTTYLLLAREPELFAAGVVLYGVADLLHLDETSHRFERHYLHTMVGPLPEAVDRYRERSPVSVARDIVAPLLILQGSDDEAVPPEQSQRIVAELRRHGRTVEYHEYEGEGHGWSRPETVVDELERTVDFLRRHVLRWRR